MSGTLATLRIALGMDASGVAKGAAVAKAEVKGLSRGLAGASKAGRHFVGSMSGLAKTVGLIGGLSVAVGGIKFIKDSVAAAQEMGRTVEDLTAITGASTEAASQFTDAFDKFGIDARSQTRIIGYLQKGLAVYALDAKKATAIQTDYGFAVLDSNGKVKDAFTVIRDFTAYFNDDSIPAWKKSAAGAKLFGRSWVTMLPIFKLGQKGYDDALGSAMKLTDQEIKDLKDLRDSQRAYNDEVGDLKVKIGLMVVPELAKLTKAATAFVSSHEADIRLWFKQGLELAKQFGTYLATTVVPTVVNLAKTAVNFWNSIPPPLRDLLVKGLVAERAIKFLFGFSITGVVQDVVGGALKGLVGSFFQRGGTPANPLFVADVAGALGGKGGVPGGGGSSMLGKVGTGLAVGAAVIGVAGFVAEAGTYLHDVDVNTKATNAKLADFARTSPTLAQMDAQIAALAAMPTKLSGLDKILFDANASGVKDTWQKNMDALAAVREAVVALPGRTGAEFADAIAGLEAKGLPITATAIEAQLEADRQGAATAAAAAAKWAKEDARDIKGAVRGAGNAARQKMEAIAADERRAARQHLHYLSQVKWATEHGFSRIAPGISATASAAAQTLAAVAGVAAGITTLNGNIGYYNGSSRGLAAGGRAAANQSYLVGEERAEMLHMGARGGWVDPDPGLAAAGAAIRAVAGGGGGEVYHFHIGTLIANDQGLDELERRMDSRRRHRTRGGMRLAGTG